MSYKNGYEAAVDYASKGYNVLRVVKNGKVPQEKHGCKDATNDLSIIKDRFENVDCNIGIAPDPSLVVLDLDGAKGKETFENLKASLGDLPDTYSSCTPRDGFHLFFRLPSDTKIKNTCNIADSIDIRGCGAYVVEAPSVGKGNDGKLYDYTAQTEIPRKEDLPELPKEWVDFISLKETDNNQDVKPISAPVVTFESSESSFTTSKRYRGFVKKVDPAVQGSCGQKQMFRAINIIFNGFGLSYADGREILEEYNSRCNPPWSSEKDVKWIETAIKKATETPLLPKGHLANKERNGKKQIEKYYDLVDKLYNNEFAQFDENKDFEKDEKYIEENADKVDQILDDVYSESIAAIKCKENTYNFADEAILESICEEFKSRKNSFIGEMIRTTSDNLAVGLCSGLQIGLGIAGVLRPYVKVKGRRIGEHGRDIEIHPALDVRLLAGSGGAKTSSIEYANDCLRYIGVNKAVSSNARTGAKLREDVMAFPVRNVFNDEAARKGEMSVKNKDLREIDDAFLDLYTAASKKQFSFCVSRTESDKFEKQFVEYPFVSRISACPTISHIKWIKTNDGKSSFTDGRENRKLYIASTKINADKIVFATAKEQYETSKERRTANNTRSMCQSAIDILKPWKDVLGKRGDELATGQIETIDGKNKPVRLFTQVGFNSVAAAGAYVKIEKYCYHTAIKMDRAGNYFAAADFARIPDTVMRLALIYALDRCNPYNCRNLKLNKRDIRLAFETVLLLSEDVKNKMFYFCENSDDLDVCERLCNTLQRTAEETGKNVFKKKTCSQIVSKITRGVARYNATELMDNRWLALLETYGNVEREYVDDGGIKSVTCVKFIKPWEPVDNYVNYKTDELTAIHEYLKDETDDVEPVSETSDEDPFGEDVENGWKPEPDSIVAQKIDTYKTIQRLNKEYPARSYDAELQKENDLLKEKLNRQEIELDQAKPRRKAQKSDEEREQELEKELAVIKRKRQQGSLEDYAKQAENNANQPQNNELYYTDEETQEEVVEALESPENALFDATQEDYEEDYEEASESLETLATAVCAGRSDACIELNSTKTEYSEPSKLYRYGCRVKVDGKQSDMFLSDPSSSDRYIVIRGKNYAIPRLAHQALMRFFTDSNLEMSAKDFDEFATNYVGAGRIEAIEEINNDLQDVELELVEDEYGSVLLDFPAIDEDVDVEVERIAA